MNYYASKHEEARDEAAHLLALEQAKIRTNLPGRTPSFADDDIDLFTSTYIGIRGESEFGYLFRLAVDTEVRPGGDGGRDFEVDINGVPTVIDVKTAMKPYYLFVMEKKINRNTHWFVLFGFDPSAGRFGRPYFVGWDTRDIMAREELRQYKVMNRRRHNSKLRTIDELTEMMNKRTYEQTNHRDATASPSGSLRNGPTQTLQVPLRR